MVASAGGGVGAGVASLVAWLLAHYQRDSYLAGHPATAAPGVVFDHGTRLEPCERCLARCGLDEGNRTSETDSTPSEEVWTWSVLGVRVEIGINRKQREILGAFTVGISLHKGGGWCRALVGLLCEFLGRLPEIFGVTRVRARGRYDLGRLGA